MISRGAGRKAAPRLYFFRTFLSNWVGILIILGDFGGQISKMVQGNLIIRKILGEKEGLDFVSHVITHGKFGDN